MIYLNNFLHANQHLCMNDSRKPENTQKQGVIQELLGYQVEMLPEFDSLVKEYVLSMIWLR